MPKTLDLVSGKDLPRQLAANLKETYVVTTQEKQTSNLSEAQLREDFKKAYGSMGHGRRTDDIIGLLRDT